MNATELHSIVKDVDRDIWPVCVKWDEAVSRFYDLDGCGHPSDAIIERAFVGNMVIWLMDHGFESWPVSNGPCDPDGIKYIADYSDFDGAWASLVEALAAACKAVGGKGGDAN